MTSTWFLDTGQLHVGTNIYSKMRNIVISNFNFFFFFLGRFYACRCWIGSTWDTENADLHTSAITFFFKLFYFMQASFLVKNGCFRQKWGYSESIAAERRKFRHPNWWKKSTFQYDWATELAQKCDFASVQSSDFLKEK